MLRISFLSLMLFGCGAGEPVEAESQSEAVGSSQTATPPAVLPGHVEAVCSWSRSWTQDRAVFRPEFRAQPSERP